jgi:DNA polymerase-3 subunit gamma/tau
LKTFPGAKLEAVKRKGEEASLLVGISGADDEPPPAEEYPADDDVPESDY